MTGRIDWTEIIDLRDRWRAHENDECASQNTIFAVFGVASPLGHYADTVAFNNPPYVMWLEDKAYDAGWQGRKDCDDDRPRSTAAAVMIEHGRIRHRGRRIPMTTDAYAALLAYLEEKVRLMQEIVVVADRGSREHREIRRNHERAINKHIRATEQAIERLKFSRR